VNNVHVSLVRSINFAHQRSVLKLNTTKAKPGRSEMGTFISTARPDHPTGHNFINVVEPRRVVMNSLLHKQPKPRFRH